MLNHAWMLTGRQGVGWPTHKGRILYPKDIFTAVPSSEGWLGPVLFQGGGRWVESLVKTTGPLSDHSSNLIEEDGVKRPNTLVHSLQMYR
jgi:hypothetical protein